MKPLDALDLGIDADFSWCSFCDAKNILTKALGGGAHYMLIVHPDSEDYAARELRYHPKVMIQTQETDDIDEWMLIAFKYDKGLQHKIVWSPGA